MCSVGKIIPDLILCKLAEVPESAYYNRMKTQDNRPPDTVGSRDSFFLMILSEPKDPYLIATSIYFNVNKRTFEATTAEIHPLCFVPNILPFAFILSLLS